MGFAKLTNFGGLRPKANPRALPDTDAQTADNLLPTTTEYRPLLADTTVLAASGVTNPKTIYRLQRNADGSLNTNFASAGNWQISTIEKSFVKGQLNDAATERTYVTFNDGSSAPHVIDATGDNRQLGVPAPVTAPVVTLNAVDQFTVENRATGLQAAASTAIAAIKANVTVVWRGADDPGTSTTGYLDRSAAFGFDPVNPQQQVRLFRLASAGGGVSNSYSAIDASNFSWVFDPLLASFTFAAAASPSWAGGAATPHIALAFPAYGPTVDLNGSAINTALAAIAMPGKNDGTKLFTGAQATAIVAQLQTLVDPAGAVKPRIDALRTKVAEVKQLLDGGGRSSLAAMVQAFYSKTDVAAEITSAIANFATDVFQQADLVAKSGLAAQDFGGSGP